MKPSRTPVVYAPQQPSRYDTSVGLWIPSVNLNAARRYGRIEIMLPPNLSSMLPGLLIDVLRRKMEGFEACDYLLAVGDPMLIAAAAGIAFRATGGKLRMLKWDRVARDYIEVEVDLEESR